MKNLYGRDKYSLFSLIVNKMREFIIAARIEKVYSKEEILLLYLNSVPFGEDTCGVESAAHRFFSKSARNLNIEESAVLVGMLRANTRYNPVTRPENALARRNTVLQLLEKVHRLDSVTVDSLQNLPLVTRYENINSNGPAGYFVFQVRKKATTLLDSINNATGSEYDLEKDGLEIHTTLNLKIQQQGNAAVKEHLGKMQKLLDRDPKTGDVLSWIGGNHFRLLPFDMVAENNPGSRKLPL